MEKVYITKVLKGKEPIHSIGMLDTDTKKLYTPFVSKNGTCVIETIEVDYLTNEGNGNFRCERMIVTPEGKHFLNVYFAHVLKEKEVK